MTVDGVATYPRESGSISISSRTEVARHGTPAPAGLARAATWGLICGLWLVCVGLGLARLWQYKNVPGEAETPPAVWPNESRIRPSEDKLTLVMIAHPRCPCTRASIAELRKLMPRLSGRVAAFIVFIRPSGTSNDWVNTDTWRGASTIDGVTVLRDDDGAEAKIFRASTSGYVVLYGADRRLLFSGGITGARGHEGENPGENRVVSLVTTGAAQLPTAPVFGCRLQDPNADAKKESGFP